MTTILRVLVGSRAHGLARPESDYDYRGVFITPTSEILSLNYKYKPTTFIEGKEDDTAYEIGHFLQLCTKANPAVLEVLVGKETICNTSVANKMRELMPYMFSPEDAFVAFTGYSKSQEKKLLDNHMGRRNKYGVAYIRTLSNLIDLFDTGTFSLEVKEELKPVLESIRNDEKSNGEIIDIAQKYIEKASIILPTVTDKKDLNVINEFLLSIRKEYW